ncbi:hypothetical protein BH23ACT6_BH23ACT6_21850 [soil metagenome]
MATAARLLGVPQRVTLYTERLVGIPETPALGRAGQSTRQYQREERE